jgi:hypothetical protein
MDRRTFLRRAGMAALSPLWARELSGAEKNLARDTGTADLRNATHVDAGFRRRRPSDANWPSQAAWKRLSDEVDGNLIPVEFPIEAFVKDTGTTACEDLMNNIHNPYYLGDQPGLTQTLGWVDAWVSKPSVYAVSAKNADHIAAAVNFARDNDLRLVVKGGGHSYQAPRTRRIRCSCGRGTCTTSPCKKHLSHKDARPDMPHNAR